MEAAAGGAGVIGARTGTAIPSFTIATFTSGTVTGVAAITVAAIVLATLGTVPALPATALAILAMAVHRVIVPLLQLFRRVRVIVPAIVLPLQLFLRARAIARMPQATVRGRARGRRVLCRRIQGIVRASNRVPDPARMKPAAISVHRRQPAPRQLPVRTYFQDPSEGVIRAREGTKA